MDIQSQEITSTTPSDDAPESEGSISPARSISPSMMDENPPRRWDNEWRELELARPPSPWLRDIQIRQDEQQHNVAFQNDNVQDNFVQDEVPYQEGDNLVVEDEVPELVQPGDDFVFLEGSNTIPHFNYIPPAQLQMPFPVFQSTYNSGSCPYWRTESTQTSVSLTVRCEDCQEVSVIIRQNNLQEIQLSAAEFYSIFQTVRNNFVHRR